MTIIGYWQGLQCNLWQRDQKFLRVAFAVGLMRIRLFLSLSWVLLPVEE